MIKIFKGLNPDNIPVSLRYPLVHFFAPSPVSLIAKNTNKKRNELIKKGEYIDTKPYNSRYKFKDTKTELIKIYKNKCAFCEQKIEQFHVEHYRPKQLYYWLAFSWDNLLCACHYCNEHKGVSFQLSGVFSPLKIKGSYLKSINTLSAQNDLLELPDLVNPEITDPSGELIFDKDGCISSVNNRFSYTIATCKIDRKYLNDNRKAILDSLIADINTEYLYAESREDLIIAVGSIVRKFINDYLNENNEYRAFRKYVIDNWLNDEVKKIFT